MELAAFVFMIGVTSQSEVLLVETASIADSLDIAKSIAQALALGNQPYLADSVPRVQAVPALTAARPATAKQNAPPLLVAAALALL